MGRWAIEFNLIENLNHIISIFNSRTWIQGLCKGIVHRKGKRTCIMRMRTWISHRYPGDYVTSTCGVTLLCWDMVETMTSQLNKSPPEWCLKREKRSPELCPINIKFFCLQSVWEMCVFEEVSRNCLSWNSCNVSFYLSRTPREVLDALLRLLVNNDPAG